MYASSRPACFRQPGRRTPDHDQGIHMIPLATEADPISTQPFDTTCASSMSKGWQRCM